MCSLVASPKERWPTQEADPYQKNAEEPRTTHSLKLNEPFLKCEPILGLAANNAKVPKVTAPNARPIVLYPP